MKRFIIIFSIVSFLFLSVNAINAFAQQSQTLAQGIYNVRDANLLLHNPITIKTTPANSNAIIIVINSEQTIKALLRLNSQLPQQVLPPLNYDDSIIIFGNGNITFS